MIEYVIAAIIGVICWWMGIITGYYLGQKDCKGVK